MARFNRRLVLTAGFIAFWILVLLFASGGRRSNLALSNPGSTLTLSSQGHGETIFVLMAAFREPQCQATLESLFLQARNPERLRVGLFQQMYRRSGHDAKRANPKLVLSEGAALSTADDDFSAEPEDADCLDFQQRCPDGHPLCMFLPLIRTKRVDFMEATGPLYGRAGAQTLLQDEDWYLQIDSHTQFVPEWDAKMIAEWHRTGNPKAVLSTYPPATGVNVPKHVAPTICASAFQPQSVSFIMRHSNRVDVRSKVPVLTPFWAGGFSFGRAQTLRDVPFDPHAPYVFDGEEFSTGVRLFTHGYDVYAPSSPLLFHMYEPASGKGTKPKYWEFEWAQRYPVQQRSLRRIWAMLGIPPSSLGLPADFDSTWLRRYGVGNLRTVRQYAQWIGVDFSQPKGVADLCDRILGRTSEGPLERVPDTPEYLREADPYQGLVEST